MVLSLSSLFRPFAVACLLLAASLAAQPVPMAAPPAAAFDVGPVVEGISEYTLKSNGLRVLLVGGGPQEAALKAHLVKRGYGDIEVKVSGGYNPTSTSAESPLIQAQIAVLERNGLNPLLWPRNAGSYPGFVFTEAPLSLASGHFGLGHGSGAHAPDEYYLIEAENPKVRGYDGAVMSFVEYLYELGK